MKRLAVLACAVSLTVAGCNGSISPVAPSGVVKFVSQLAGSQNVPPAGSLEAGATGTVQITMTPASDGSGNYTASFTLSLANLVKSGVLPAAYAPMDTMGSVIVAGYIHQGAAGALGGAVVSTGISQTAPVASPTGTAFLTISGITITSTVAQGMIANASGFYFNLYSAMNQNGVLRGQLVKQ